MQVMFGLATQDYTADINILPRQRFFDPTRLLSPRSKEETVKLINEGERATWPKLDMINNCTKVSRQINSALQRLRKKL
jgi:NTE family protein